MFLIRRIRSPLTEALYMTRLYLFGAPRMPDGSFPFDAYGAPREGSIKPKGWQAFFHRIATSDFRWELHNHPWRWGLAIILWGGYYEHRRVEGDLSDWSTGSVIRRRVRPGSIVFLRHTDFHRVELIDGRPSYSLFIAGPLMSGWGFRKDGVGPYVPAREYTQEKGIVT